MRTLTITLLLLIGANAFAEDVVVKSARRAPSPMLKVKSSGVPAFDFVDKKKGARVTRVPQLDIGEEATVEAGSLTDLRMPPAKTLNANIVKKLNVTPIPFEKEKKEASKPVPGPKNVVKVNPNFQTPKVPVMKEIPPPVFPEIATDSKDIKELSASERKLIDALIFLETHKNYSLALGLFAELISEAPEKRTEAAYHLALTAKGLSLVSEFRAQMLKVLKDPSPDWQKKAAMSLAENAIEGDKELVPILDPKVDELNLTVDNFHQYQLNRAKYYLDKGNVSEALHATELIDEKSNLFGESLFLKAIITYRTGEAKKALGFQEQGMKALETKKSDTTMRSFAALTLARMYFQQGKYKEAYQSYLRVDKNHPDWPQAMIEQSWSQILIKDYEGAAGNMFTFHTDFFKHRFAPESYVVRTIGYLNLCQYGDGIKVLYDLKKRYTPMVKMLAEYKSKNKSDMNYYDTVKTLFQTPDERVITGLPRSFVVELARHPAFTNEQKMINYLEDQGSKFNNLTVELIETERAIIKKQSDTQSQIISIRKRKKTADADKEVAQLERVIEGLKIQQSIAKRGRNSIKDLRSQALNRMDKEKDGFKQKGGAALKDRFKDMFSILDKTLDQSELLAYEVYSGAGEHLRYQLAGGDTGEKTGIELKPGEGKSLKWEFKGEIWEDELGYFRSSLKNVCAQDERLSSTQQK